MTERRRTLRIDSGSADIIAMLDKLIETAGRAGMAGYAEDATSEEAQELDEEVEKLKQDILNYINNIK